MAKKKFYVPVSWTMFKCMEVEADNAEAAAKIAEDTGEAKDGEYAKGSFEVDKESIEEMKED